jgi:hypothetical protein
MLEFAYTDRMPPGGIDEVGKMLHYVGLYQIADKYSFPDLEKQAALGLRTRLKAWLQRADNPKGDGRGDEQLSPQDFCKVVERVYELPHAHLTHPLVSWLLKYTALDPAASSDSIRRLKPLVRRAAEETAEYGRDLFLYTLRKD